MLIICLYIVFVGTGENAALEFETSYLSVAPSFVSDYDRENPLTKKVGAERLLEI